MSSGRLLHPSLNRTEVVYDRLDHQGLLFKKEGEPHLSIDGIDYRILDSTVTDFNNPDKPLVSVGKKQTRELVILDPLSKNLDKIYQTLREKISDMDAKGQEDEIQDVLDYTIYFVRWHLKRVANNKEKVKEIRNDERNWIATHEGTPVISLDTFIEEGAGMCRHHALFMSYLVTRLISDDLLPPGNVFTHRGTIKSGNAHVWAIYKPLQTVKTHYDFYLIDSIKKKKAFNLQDYGDYWKENIYGEKAINHCFSRHNKSDLHHIHYDKIGMKKRYHFELDLLDCRLEEQKSILAAQSMADLTSLKNSLQHSKQLDVSHENVESLIRIIDRKMKLKFIQLAAEIIASGKLKLNAPLLMSFFAGKSISTQQGNIRVPKTCEHIYNKITRTNLESASLATLDKLMLDIKESSQRAADKDHSYRDETTRDLLIIFKELNIHELGDCHQQLEDFQVKLVKGPSNKC